MRVSVQHTLGDLERDMLSIVRRAPRELSGVVREGIRTGNSVAKDFARQSAGSHGKLYHRAFSYEMRTPYMGFGAAVYAGEYGPDASKPQGGMSFEGGSRNQKPHLDLARSADLIAPAFAQEVRHTVAGWFW